MSKADDGPLLRRKEGPGRRTFEQNPREAFRVLSWTGKRRNRRR